MSTPAWGLASTRYEQMYVEGAKYLGVDAIASPVVPFIGPDEHVLDLGCSTGWQARLFVERGCTVVGIEVDVEAASRATAWCERVVVCDLDTADLGAELGADRFDVVAAGDVLEHLRDPVRALRSLRSVLRSGGRVVASIPNVAHGSVRLALLTGAFPYEESGLLDRTHLRFFTVSSLRDLFESAGYTIDVLERVEMPIDQGTPYDASALPPGIEDTVAAMPEATTFQFVVVARPFEQGPPSSLPEEIATDGGADPLLSAQAAALRVRDETILELVRKVADLERQVQQGSRLTMRRLVRGVWRRTCGGWSRLLSRAGTSRSGSGKQSAR
jgi:2-polyprenyl-3-methyl-5-hydroxy-6-metoxy-1,4-benzoquinol methylase